jgi:type IV secretory pathway TrbD component
VASQNIAEATQRDAVLMKQLAAQSKALVLRTWRDGVDMRAMAIVTLITLPGTFTAVSDPGLVLTKHRHLQQ